MSRYTINYEEKSNLNIYLKIILTAVIAIGIIFSVFIFLVSNSAYAKKMASSKIRKHLREEYTYVGDLKVVNTYEGKEIFYVVKDFKYYYVYDENFKEVFRTNFENVASIEKMDSVFQNNYKTISIGYLRDENKIIYEIKTIYKDVVGYYYYDAITTEFLRFYILGGNNNE